MTKGKPSNKQVVQIVTYIAIVLVVVMLVGFLAYFTNGFTGDFKSFYLVVNGEEIMSSKGGYHLNQSEPLQVDVVYTFGALSEEISGYTVEVVPNTDFTFSVDGEYYGFGAEANLNAGFNIVYEEDSFTIATKGGIKEILQAMYPNKTIEVDKTQIDFSQDLVNVIVYSADGSVAITSGCSINDSPIDSVSLNMEEIVF